MAVQAERSPGDLPSYARPTAASENRRALNLQESDASKTVSPHSRRRLKSPLITTSSEPPVFRRYMLPTASSRSKTRSSEYLRFLHLSPEIRNCIYQYTMDSASRVINLHRSRPYNAVACLPALLGVNKQVHEEAGGYYFSKGSFVIVNRGLSANTLQAWLEIIGNKNRRCLANNRNVVIRFVFPVEEFTRVEQYGLHYRYYARVITLDDAAHLTGLASEFQRLTRDYPMTRH